MVVSDHIEHDFYEILNLPFTETSTTLSKQQIKVAYHRALLRHHPDKAAGALAANSPTTKTKPATSSLRDDEPHTRTYTVDEITAAYKTLSDPYLRAEYDRSLRLQRLGGGGGREGNNNGGGVFHTGLEVVDLEDLNYEEGQEGQATGAFWYRGCRCGDERGFLITEQNLEREAEHGEIVVGCRGCSLWMKVLFAVETEEGDAGDDAPGEDGKK